MAQHSAFKDYLTTFLCFDARAVRRAVALNFAAALLEGVGLLLLLPLLTLAGVLNSGDPHSPHWLENLSHLFEPIAPDKRLLPMLGLFVVLISVQSGLMLLRDREAQSLQLRFVDHLRTVLYRAIASARWDFLAQHHSSEPLSVLTTDVQRVGVGTHFLSQLFTTLVMFIVYLGVALRISAPVTGLALLTGAALWWLLRASREVAHQSGVLLSQANQGLFIQIQEFLAALKLIKIHGEEAAHVGQFTAAVARLRERQIEFQRIRTRVQMVYRIGGALVLSGLTYLALVVVPLPTPQLLVMIAVFGRMLPQLSGVHSQLQQLSHMLPAFTTWRQWVTAGENHRDPMPLPSEEAWRLQHGLTLSRLAYRHPQGHHTLQVRELFIPARRTTAIIGPTGSGKTTLLDLISGLALPAEGHVLVDGLALAARPGWRQRIAYVPQESTIFDGTVRENLTWGNRAVSEVRIERALQQAAAGFLRGLPQGLDTTVGERGVRLSGGERQRLALARALLREPQLLVLDEATNALDRDSQQLILEAIHGLHGQVTVLIVTHRHEELAALIDGRVHITQGIVGTWQPVAK